MRKRQGGDLRIGIIRRAVAKTDWHQQTDSHLPNANTDIVRMTIALLKLLYFSCAFKVCVTRLNTPLLWSVRPSFRFLGFSGLWSHCSCPDHQVTSIMAPAHPQATGVAAFPALLVAISEDLEVDVDKGADCG